MLHLDYRDVRPLYAQLTDKIRQQISGGVLVQGDKLPSVRELAVELSINPNTIQRAYESLEQEGYLYTVAGKGSFAAPQADVNAARRDRLLREFDASAAELLFLGMTAGELAGRLEAAARQTVREERSYD